MKLAPYIPSPAGKGNQHLKQKHNGVTPADDMASQIITYCGNFTLDFKQLWLRVSHSSYRHFWKLNFACKCLSHDFVTHFSTSANSLRWYSGRYSTCAKLGRAPNWAHDSFYARGVQAAFYHLTGGVPLVGCGTWKEHATPTSSFLLYQTYPPVSVRIYCLFI